MLKTFVKSLSHGINLVRHQFRDVGIPVKRSSRWPTIEHHFLATNPTCAACGGTDRLNVHHCRPFHDFPELELDLTNLITLCMGANECHLKIGHCGSFQLYNPNVREDAAKVLKNPELMTVVVLAAKAEALKN